MRAGGSSATRRPAGSSTVTLKEQQQDKALDEQHERIVAETFSSLELVNTRKTLGQYVLAFDELKKENATLQADIQERDRDSLQVVEFLRNELDARNRRLEEATKKLQGCSSDYQADTRRMKDEYDVLLESKDVTINSLKYEILQLNRQVEEVAIFRRERQEIMRETESLRDKNASIVQHYEKELTKLRFQTLDEKVRLKAAETEMTRAFNSEVDARATILVDVKAKNIHENNKHLVQDKAMLEREVSDLVHLATEVKEELTNVKRDAMIDAELQQQTAKHTARLNMIAQEADARAQRLEAKLVRASTTFEAKIQEIQAESRGKVAALEGQLRQAKSSVETHRVELCKMRELSSKIVAQRSELECFFYGALEDVQRNKEAMEGGKLPLSSPRQQQQPQQRGLSSLSGMGTSSPRLPTPGNNNNNNTNHHSAAENAVSQTAHGYSTTSSAWYQSLTQREGGRRFSSLNNNTNTSGNHPPDSSQRQTSGLVTPATAARTYPKMPDSVESSALPTLVDASAPMHGYVQQQLTGARGGAYADDDAGVQFGQLSWADKEKVIRALLYFINTSYYATGGGGGGGAESSGAGVASSATGTTLEDDGVLPPRLHIGPSTSTGVGSSTLAALTPIVGSGRETMTSSSMQLSSAGRHHRAVPPPVTSKTGQPPLAPRHARPQQEHPHIHKGGRLASAGSSAPNHTPCDDPVIETMAGGATTAKKTHSKRVTITPPDSARMRVEGENKEIHML